MKAVIKVVHSAKEKNFGVWVDGEAESNLDEPACTFDDFFPYDGPIDLGYLASQKEAQSAALGYATRLQRKFGGLEIVRNF